MQPRHTGGPTRQAGGLDPITLEIQWQRLVTIVDEMDTATIRTSFSSIVGESHDFGCVLMDEDGGGPRAGAVEPAPVLHHDADLPRATCSASFQKTRSGRETCSSRTIRGSAARISRITIWSPRCFIGSRLVAFIGDDGPRVGRRRTSRRSGGDGRLPGGHACDADLLLPGGRAGRGDPRRYRGELPRARDGDGRSQRDRRGRTGSGSAGSKSSWTTTRSRICAGCPRRSWTGRSRRSVRPSPALPDGVSTYAVTADGYREPFTLRMRIEIRGSDMTCDFAGSSPQQRAPRSTRRST